MNNGRKVRNRPHTATRLKDAGRPVLVAKAGGRLTQAPRRIGSHSLNKFPLNVERIPFDETREYVERVSENLGVYRQRLADEPPAPAPMSPILARE